MKFDQYDIVTSTSTGANSLVKAGEIGTIAHATNSVVFIYWHKNRKITRQTSAAFSIERTTYVPETIVSRKEIDNAYLVYKSRRASNGMKRKAKPHVENSVETPSFDTPLGAVSALLNDVEYTPLEQSMIVYGLQSIINRFNAHNSMDGTLCLSGSAIDKANELSLQLDEINRQLAEIGITPEQLSSLRGE